MDSIAWRGVERLVIAIGGIVFAILGYLLYRHGLTTGRNNLSVKSKWGQLALSGLGPGLFFMCFGAAILVAALIHGKASSSGSKAEAVSPAKQDTIWPRVKKVSVKELGVSESTLTRTASWKEDLGADSLDMPLFVAAVEEEFGIEITPDEFENCNTFGDIAALVSRKLTVPPSPRPTEALHP